MEFIFMLGFLAIICCLFYLGYKCQRKHVHFRLFKNVQNHSDSFVK